MEASNRRISAPDILYISSANTARLRNRSPQPPLRRGAKSLIKSPNLAGDLGGSILVKNLNRAVLSPVLEIRAQA